MLSFSFQTLEELLKSGLGLNIWPMLILGSYLLCWRLWRFTIRPYMKPSEPRELPFWIPYFGNIQNPNYAHEVAIAKLISIGHAYSFFTDYNGALEQARTYFSGTKEPYSVWITGARLYICTSPEDVSALYRNTATVSYHNVVEDLYRWIGISNDGFTKMFTLDSSAKHNAGLPSPQAPDMMIVEHHRLQTKPGALLDDMLYERLIPTIGNVLEAVALGNSTSVVTELGDDTVVSLLQLCTDMFLRGTTTAFLGTKIWDVAPNFVKSFELWERSNWKFMFQLPDIISGDMLQARNEIIDALTKYLDIPEEERADRNHFVKSVETMMRDIGCDKQDMAKVFMLHLWGILGNIYKVAFWTLAYLVYDPALLKSIRAEGKLALKDGQLDEHYLAENCPLLDSFISETLRLTVTSALVRDIIEPTPIGGKILQPGNKILVPYRLLHHDNAVWGADPSVMQAGRFAEQPKLQSSKSYRPFGGGNTLCPGRFLAKRSIKYAIAALLANFEVELDVAKTQAAVGGKGRSVTGRMPFPLIDYTKPSPGVSLPVRGHDVFLILRKSEAMKQE